MKFRIILNKIKHKDIKEIGTWNIIKQELVFTTYGLGFAN